MQGSNDLQSDAGGSCDVRDSSCYYTDVYTGSLHEPMTIQIRYVHVLLYHVLSMTDGDDAEFTVTSFHRNRKSPKNSGHSVLIILISSTLEGDCKWFHKCRSWREENIVRFRGHVRMSLRVYLLNKLDVSLCSRLDYRRRRFGGGLV
jgi:hypothetical protein